MDTVLSFLISAGIIAFGVWVVAGTIPSGTSDDQQGRANGPFRADAVLDRLPLLRIERLKV